MANSNCGWALLVGLGCVLLLVLGVERDAKRLGVAVQQSMPTMRPAKRTLSDLVRDDNERLRTRIDEAQQRIDRARGTPAMTEARPGSVFGKASLLPTPRPAITEDEDHDGLPTAAAAAPGRAARAGSGASRALADKYSSSTVFDRDRAMSVATRSVKGGPPQIILTFVNKVRFDFATSWVAHVRRLGLSNYLVGATDQNALRRLVAERIPCFDMTTNLPEGEWPWGSPSFKALGPHKIELIYKAISWGLEVVITDIDAFVLREPFAYMARYPDAGFLTTSDHLGNTTRDDGLETHGGIHTAFNIGYMFFRASALPLVEEWRRVIRADPRQKWDQGEFNRLARLEWKPNRRDGLSDERLFWSYKQKVIGGVLPLALFCGGHNYFVSQFAQRRNLEPYSIHTTYQYAAAAGKRHRLREARVWIDPPEYYAPEGGVLSFDLDVPESLVSPAGGMSVQGHIALINHQLRQIRSGLALATALGRKLVLPSVTCGYDKYWGPLWRGVIPGTHTWALPIRNCPLDHYLEVRMPPALTRARPQPRPRSSPRGGRAAPRNLSREASPHSRLPYHCSRRWAC